ncbi:MAG: B12-binding domain-containing radical SAM protein [Bacillota bacterium]
MRILFLNPPSLSEENVVRDSIYGCWCKGKRIGGAMTPPYPQLELATLMKNEGYIGEIIDALAEDITFDQIKSKVSSFDVLVLLTSVMTFGEDAVILKEIKKANPGILSIVYGSLPTFMPEFCLKAEAVDIGIRREAEYVLRDFLRAYGSGGQDWKNVKGIIYRLDGKAVVNEFYPFIENLDELPFVDWTLLKNSNRYFNPSIKRYPYVTDLTTRGCFSKCIYCMSPGFYGAKVRARSAQNVLDGFRKHIENGYKEVYIRDELFTAFRSRNREICRGMLREKMDLTWLCSVKVGTANLDDLKLMKEAGCHTIKIGVESGSQKILDNIKKGITLDQTRQIFEWANSIGLDTHAHLMIGNPGETVETLGETIKFVKEIDPTTVTFGILTPYPGTKLFDTVTEKYPELKDEYNLPLDKLHTTSFYSDAYCQMAPNELEKWITRAHRAFYLRPYYFLKWAKKINSVSDLKKVAKAGLKVVDFSIRGDK